MQLPVYLDYAATTPVEPEVAEAMLACLTAAGNFGNPASRSHLYGWKAEEAVECARRDVADLIGADPREIVWTSGATESDNLAIKGAVAAWQRRFPERTPHIVSSALEHKAVLDTCAHLQQAGVAVTLLTPDAEGLIAPEAVAAALRDTTVLVSLMHVNNELGNITDVAEIGALCKEKDVIFHVDAAQSAGKIEIDLGAIPADLLSLSAHKFYGPKGAGALYVRRSSRAALEALIHGGGHERGLRSGTLATHQIVGMGTAARIARERLAGDIARITELRQRFLGALAAVDDVRLNGHPVNTVPGIINLCFGGIEGETLLTGLHRLAVSSGSACTSASVEPSHVLAALGLSDADAHASLRFSLGRFTSVEEVDFAVAEIRSAVAALRHPAP